MSLLTLFFFIFVFLLLFCFFNSFFFFFFFSSRRRHTRFDYDWSSDVCSSDLLVGRRVDGGLFQVLGGVREAGADAVLHGIGADLVQAARALLHARRGLVAQLVGQQHEIGRASCRERV